MIRPALAALLAAAPSIATGQAVTRPVVTLSAGYLHAPEIYDEAGSTDGPNATGSAIGLGLSGEAPVLRRGGLTASAGARLTFASYGLDLGGTGESTVGGDVRPQNLDLYGRLGNERASGMLGVSLNLGRDQYDESDTFNINGDGQHAVVGQLRGEAPAGRVRLFAQADASITLASDGELRLTTVGDPDQSVTYALTFDEGDLYGVQAGAAVLVGPVELGLAAFYAARTSPSREFPDGVPPGFPPGSEDVAVFPFGYTRALGLVPSVVYRAPAAPVVVQLDGSFSGFYSMEGVPVGLTLSGENGPVTRPAVTLSVGVGL